MYDLYEREKPHLTEADVKRAARVKIASLDDREHQIIGLVALGLNDRQIACSLCISDTKVRELLSGVYDKLDISDRLELVVYAYYHCLANLPQ